MIDELMELSAKGGIVLLTILVLSMVAWSLVFWKALEFIAEPRENCAWMPDAMKAATLGDVRALREVCPKTECVTATVLRFVARSPTDPQRRRRLAEEALSMAEARITRHLPLIATLAATAPLLGLLGTVLGMVESFDALGSDVVRGGRGLAEGVSRALLTTQAGLVAGLPLLIAHGWLVSMGRRFLDRGERLLHRFDRGVAPTETAS